MTLGIARAAMDDLLELAGAKTQRAAGSSWPSARRCRPRWPSRRRRSAPRAACWWTRSSARHERAAASAGITTEDRTALRLAATHAARSSAAVVDSCYALGGGSSIYATSPLQRRFRDVHAATQHMLVAPATLELTGRLLLGLPTDVGQL